MLMNQRKCVGQYVQDTHDIINIDEFELQGYCQITDQVSLLAAINVTL